MSRSSPVQAAETVDSVRAFKERVAFERACAARGDHPLSLISVDLGTHRAPQGMAHAEIGALARSLRSTDAIGYLEQRRLGILLPYTSPADARLVYSSLVGAQDALGQAGCEILDLSEPSAPPHRRDSHQHRPQRLPTDPAAATYRPVLATGADTIFCLVGRPLPRSRRVLDILASSAGLIVFAPLMAVIAIAVKATSPGPAIFKHLRTGRNLRRFPLYKFRTMHEGAEKELPKLAHLNEMTGPLFKSDVDPRLTPIGAFLRRWSLDELPQLVNVLKGDMTLLGPRALSPTPSSYKNWQLRRFVLTPGVACTWQASRRAEVDFDEWMRSDLEYVDQGSSLLTDLRLLFRVLAAVVKRSGAR